MLLKPLTRFILRTLFWLIPAIALWWVSVNTIIFPSLRIVVGSIAFVWPAREEIGVYNSPNNQWLIRTNLLTKEQPTESSHLRKRLVVLMNPLLLTTAGFPILWAFSMAMPRRRIYNFVVGNTILFMIAVVLLWISILTLINSAIITQQIKEIWFNSSPHPVSIYPVWVINFLSQLQLVIGYLTSGFIIPVIWYALNRRFANRLFKW